MSELICGKSRIALILLLCLSFFSLGMQPAPDTTPPNNVSITSPADKAVVSGVVNILAQASDNKGVSKVDFYIDSALKVSDTSTPYSYSWDTTQGTNGTHTLKVTAYDAANNNSSAQVNVTVSNAAPPPPTPPVPPTPPSPATELSISSIVASSYSGAFLPVRVIDKNLATYWQGATLKAPWLLTFDLAKLYSLTKISIFWHKTNGATNYTIQASTNGTTWVNLQSGLSSAGGAVNPNQKDYSISGFYRYVRLYISKAQSWYPICYEVKLYGVSPDSSPPKITSLVPIKRATFISGDTINIAATVSSPDLSNLQYRFSLDTKIIKDWPGTSSFNFITSLENQGKHSLKVEVRDSAGGTDSKTVEIYIFRKFPKPAG